MTSLAFSLILFSGLMHALYNLLIKRSRNKTVFIWWMFVISTGLFTIMLPFLPGVFPRPDFLVLFLGAGGAFCFVLYHLFTGRAYQSGDLSLTYPLSQTAILYLPLWGVWLLGEHLSIDRLGGSSAGGRRGVPRPVAAAHGSGTPASLLQPCRPVGASRSRRRLRLFARGHHRQDRCKSLFPSLLHLHPRRLHAGADDGQSPSPLLPPLDICRMAENRRFIITGRPADDVLFLSFRYGLSLSPLSYASPGAAVERAHRRSLRRRHSLENRAAASGSAPLFSSLPESASSASAEEGSTRAVIIDIKRPDFADRRPFFEQSGIIDIRG